MTKGDFTIGGVKIKRVWTVVQVPYGGGYSSLNLANTPNTRRAPKALKKEFMRQKNFMSNERFGNRVSSWDNVAWPEIPLDFFGQNDADGWGRMHESVLSYLNLKFLNWKSDGNILFLGGSHSITASTYIGTSQTFGRQQTGLIVLDAHPDCCSKANWPIHSDWLRWLIEDEYVLPENVLIIGLRQIEKSEKEFLEKYNIKHCSAKNIDAHIPTLRILEKFRKLEAIYLSIDIDVASAAYAPGTGCPSPGGYTDSEFIDMISPFKYYLPNLKAVDIVEINPLKWWQKYVLRYDATVDLGVKLIKEIIS